MYNIHTYRRRQSAQNLTEHQKKEKTYHKSGTLIPQRFPYEKNPLIHAIQNKEVDEEDIYSVLQNRGQVHKTLQLKYPLTKSRPQSAMLRSESNAQQKKSNQSSLKRPSSAISTSSSRFEQAITSRKETGPETGIKKTPNRPQSAISRTLKRPYSATSNDELFVRPMSAALVGQMNTIISQSDAKGTSDTFEETSRPRYQSRSGMDLRRPSSAYRSKSAANRIVHMLPHDVKDLISDGNSSQGEEVILQAIESVAENCLDNYNKSKDERPKWTTGFRGKYSKEPCFEWTGAEKERQVIFEQQLREATWEQSKQERIEKDAMDYITIKNRYKKQRALFKAQQQKNMIKSVVLVKEPRTVKQLENILKEPTKLGGRSRPQSALATRRRSQDENMPPSASVFLSKRGLSGRPQSGRPQVFSFKNDCLEWADGKRDPSEEIKMLDRWTATHS